MKTYLLEIAVLTPIALIGSLVGAFTVPLVVPSITPSWDDVLSGVVVGVFFGFIHRQHCKRQERNRVRF